MLETDDEQQIQKVCQVVQYNLKENKDWISYVESTIQPLIDLEKGKLCQDESKDKSGLDNSDNNIFDDDFMRSDFGMGNMSADPSEENMNLQSTSPDGQGENKPTNTNQEDEEDQRKFFEKITKCFTSNS